MLYDANGNQILTNQETDQTEVKMYNLTVMSFNVQRWSGLNSNIDLIKKIIAKHDPDIIGFQEFRKTISGADVYTTLFADYPYNYYMGSVENPTGVVSKYELSDASSVVFATQGTNEKRGYSKAYFTFNKQKVCWLNTHMEWGSNGADARDIRNAQAAELLEVMKQERYAICTGDFNTADCYDTNGADYLGQIKPFIDQGFHSANSSDQHGFLATGFDSAALDTKYYCIDEIIATSNIDINIVEVDKQKSDENTDGRILDHLPIVAYCRVNG